MDEAPFAVAGEGPVGGNGEGVHGDAGAVDSDFIRGATEVDEAVFEGMGTGEDEGDGLQEGAQAVGVAGLVGAGHDIGAMKRDEGRQAVVMLEKGQQMDAGVPEVDVQEVGLPAVENPREGAVFAAVDERCFAADIFEVEAADEIAACGGDDFDVGEGEFCGGLALFGEDKGAIALQAGDLPVDVQHFRFEEGGAVTGYNWHVRRSGGMMNYGAGANRKGNQDMPLLFRATKKLRFTGACL